MLVRSDSSEMNIQILNAVPIVSCCAWPPIPKADLLATLCGHLNLFPNRALQTDSNAPLKLGISQGLRPFRNSTRHKRNDQTILQERDARHFGNRSTILQERARERDSWIQEHQSDKSQGLTF